MPTYDYHCTDCGHRTEKFQKITDDPTKTCPSCKKETLKRGPGGGIGLSFKGEGFYITDYKNGGPQPKGQETCPCGEKKSSCQSTKD